MNPEDRDREKERDGMRWDGSYVNAYAYLRDQGILISGAALLGTDSGAAEGQRHRQRSKG